MSCDIKVDLGERSYPIKIGSGSIDTLGEECKAVGLSGKCLVVSDENVAPIYSENVIASLKNAGFDPVLEVLPAGEATKCHEQLIKLYSKAAEEKLDRKCFFVALGGGVVGDITGFAAASWLRGVKFVQVPTTILSMVDSSVGGKTGINIPAGKNLVGAFYQPELVLVDLDTLRTLPEREFAAGMAEVIKYGIIWEEEFFRFLEEAAKDNSLLDKMEAIVARCCEIKADVVHQDEREGGVRGILNFGHTLGHAIENVAGYGKYLHGEGVSIGMVYAAHLSVSLKGFSENDDDRVKNLCAAFNLPISVSRLKWDDVRQAMTIDKKSVGGLPKFVLANEIGSVDFGCSVPEKNLKQVWSTLNKS